MNTTAQPVQRVVSLWGSDCTTCGNATVDSMRCDLCGSDASTTPLWSAAGAELPTYTEVIEACCDRICAGDDGNCRGLHRDAVAPVIDECIERGWLDVSGPGEWS